MRIIETTHKQIVELLGGGRFVAMTGSKKFKSGIDASGNVYLSFRFSEAAVKRRNYCKVTFQQANQTYTMMFASMRGKSHCPAEEIPKYVITFEKVSGENLQPRFSDATGFYTTLF